MAFNNISSCFIFNDSVNPLKKIVFLLVVFVFVLALLETTIGFIIFINFLIVQNQSLDVVVEHNSDRYITLSHCFTAYFIFINAFEFNVVAVGSCQKPWSVIIIGGQFCLLMY